VESNEPNGPADNQYNGNSIQQISHDFSILKVNFYKDAAFAKDNSYIILDINCIIHRFLFKKNHV
jgi:hypothetical protein